MYCFMYEVHRDEHEVENQLSEVTIINIFMPTVQGPAR